MGPLWGPLPIPIPCQVRRAREEVPGPRGGGFFGGVFKMRASGAPPWQLLANELPEIG